mmetsp:Transcript_33126/g.69569  ORF Transcript_33126/g.69569 Transcript_33126/m.69569 type:complete len:247 (-) Transcript_33126:994-1734(-)
MIRHGVQPLADDPVQTARHTVNSSPLGQLPGRPNGLVPHVDFRTAERHEQRRLQILPMSPPLGPVIGQRHAPVPPSAERLGVGFQQRSHGGFPRFAVFDRQHYGKLPRPVVHHARGVGVEGEDVADHGVLQKRFARDVRRNGCVRSRTRDESTSSGSASSAATAAVGSVSAPTPPHRLRRLRVRHDAVPARTPPESRIVHLSRGVGRGTPPPVGVGGQTRARATVRSLRRRRRRRRERICRRGRRR